MRGNQSLLPVTIKQLLEAQSNAPDDTFRIDGKDINLVSIVGVIRAVTENQTNLNYVVRGPPPSGFYAAWKLTVLLLVAE